MKSNILVLSAGRRVSLVRAFEDALSDLKVDGDVYGADLNPHMSAACNILKKSFVLPAVTDDLYIDNLLRLCLEQSIKLVIPTIDTELIKLATAKDDFLENGVHLIVSDLDLVAICRNKEKTNTFFNQIGIPTPHVYSYPNLQFPCFAKPIGGSLSKNIRVLGSKEELSSWDIDINDMMFMEVVDTSQFEEYTIDIYYNKNNELCCVVPRLRYEVRGGEVSKAITNKHVSTLVKQQMSRIKQAIGCLTLQIFRNKNTDDILGIEINPRFGGGFPLTNHCGARYPEFLIREYILRESLGYFEDWSDGVIMLRFDGEIFV